MLPVGAEYCWAHVDDIAHAHVLAMEEGRSGEAYIIAGPRHSLIEAMELAERLTGVKAPRLRGSPGLLRLLSNVMGLVERVVPVPEDLSSEYLRVSAGVTYLGSNAKARQGLGYEPRSLEVGLAETLDFERKR
jgi:nucleoside-diphosphate-sugar epimerase